MTEKKINIGFILPCLDKGGVSVAALNLIGGLNDKLFNKYIILYDGKIVEYRTEHRIVDLGSPASSGILNKFKTQIFRIRKLKKIKKELNIDISVSFKDNPNITSLLSRYKDKIIMTVHTTPSIDYSGFHGAVYRFLIKMFFKRADKVITVSEGIKKDLIRNYSVGQKAEVIYNFIDIEEIKNLANKDIEEEHKPFFNDGRIIINLGRLTKAKGQKYLLKAFKYASEKQKDLKLVLIGDGELKNELEKLTDKLGIRKKVLFAGSLENPYRYLKRSDIFVLSSVYEGFGIALIEAMTCGLPVISTNCRSGPREIIEDRNGKLYGILTSVPDDTSEIDTELSKAELEIAENMISILNNNSRFDKLSELSLQRAENFSHKILIPQWEKLISDIYSKEIT